MKIMAYVTLWNSATNEVQQTYLPLETDHLMNIEFGDHVHKNAGPALGINTAQWVPVIARRFTQDIWSIHCFHDSRDDILTYNVRFAP
jgi:hypothetical protein